MIKYDFNNEKPQPKVHWPTRLSNSLSSWWSRQGINTRRKFILSACFLVPVLLMLGYFIARGMAPFGSSSLLTVDLGQQYVDFFAWFRHALLHHPTSFFYSFSKDLGGEMFGTSAYYLFSPLNLLLLFFPAGSLTSGIMLILLVRYGLAGLSFAWVLDRHDLQHGMRLVGFATAYSLMGWMIANQLNMLWLDVIIILPLIIHGLIKLLHNEGIWTYVIWLTVQMIDNYYMAWMVCLFTILFTCWQLTLLEGGWKSRARAVGRYAFGSIVAACISAVVLLPTISALLGSKASYTSLSFKLKPEYAPWRILAKFAPGAFNFHQMPSGQPNIYVGMVGAIAALFYLFDKRQKRSSRIVALLVSAFLFASCCIPVLDLLWHIGQYPVWYPSRFSYVISFWMLWLAAKVLTPDFRLSRGQFGRLVLFVILIYAFLNHVIHRVSFLNNQMLILGLLLAVITLFTFRLKRSTSPAWYDLLLVVLMCADVAVNAYASLDNIAYVTQPEFASYTKQIDNAATQIKKSDHGFYRIGKNFMRTKDDPMQADYYGGDHFSSNLEPEIPAFYGAVGQPDGDGFVSYNNGTEVTDSLLGFKYYFQAMNNGQSGNQTVFDITSMRPDLNHYRWLGETGIVGLRRNQHALPIAFGASDKVLNLRHTTLDPLVYQSNLYQLLAGESIYKQLFTIQNFTHAQFNNVQHSQTITGTTFTKKNILQPASVRLTFKVPTNNAYYMTLGNNVKSQAMIMINNRPLTQYSNYRHTIVVNLVSKGSKGRTVTITMSLKHNSLWMQDVSIYRLNERQFVQSYARLSRSPLHVTKHNERMITGNVDIKSGQQLLMTTIPYASGWRVTIDGRQAMPVKVANTFLAVPISQGHHQVSFKYTPPLLGTGALISVLTITVCAIYFVFSRRRVC